MELFADSQEAVTHDRTCGKVHLEYPRLYPGVTIQLQTDAGIRESITADHEPIWVWASELKGKLDDRLQRRVAALSKGFF